MPVFRLSWRFALYFVICALVLQIIFLVALFIKPGSIKLGYEIAALFPAGYLLGRAERGVSAKRAAALIATLGVVLFGAQMWLQTALAGIDAGFDRLPATSFLFLAALLWVVALAIGGVGFAMGQKAPVKPATR